MVRTLYATIVAVAAALFFSAAQPGFAQGGRGGDAAAARAAEMQARIKEAASAPTPKTADGRPDLSGYWTNAAGGGDPFGSAPPKLAADGKTQVLALPTVAAVNANDVASAARRKQNVALRPVYKPEYAKKAEYYFDRGDLDDPAYRCSSPGVPRIGAPSEIVTTPTAVYLLYDNQNRYRVIPTDGRKHDPNAESMPNGDAVGRWEGDTLVVDVTNLDDSTWLDKDGTYHSKDMHVVERYQRVGNTLKYDVAVEDPYFVKPFSMPTRTLIAGKSGEHVREDYPCVERSLDHMLSGEKH